MNFPTLAQLYYSFPVRLLLLHIRNHLILILVWLVLALLVTGRAGRFFGINYLFLTPEYLGKVNSQSFFLLGVGFGALFMVWNLTTYLLCSSRFPFLATLAAPFTKFCLNNSLIPIAFLITWIGSTIYFQAIEELWPTHVIFWNIVGFLGGSVTLISLLAAWFFFTNKDIGDFLKNPRSVFLNPRFLKTGRRLPNIHEIRTGRAAWRCDTYLNERLRPRLVRSVEHYDRQILSAVFSQNHFNAILVQLVAMLLLMCLGLLMDHPRFQIPTGASIFILASMGMALFGALTFWFEQWATVAFLALLFGLNLLTSFDLFIYWNRAYGLDYQPLSRAKYDYESLQKLCPPDTIAKDIASTELILNHWLEKNSTLQNVHTPPRGAGGQIQKPKLLFVCVSGGGLRAATWAMHVLQKTDAATNGDLMKKTMLISGASGGLLGATYFRELFLQNQTDPALDIHNPFFLEKIGRDLLNPVSFAIVANDLFFPIRTFRWGEFDYRIDRGYMFERQLWRNTDGLLRRKLSDYQQPEAAAKIPLVIITPFILNDARRLLISPQPISYMMQSASKSLKINDLEIDGVDFGRLFAHQNAADLSFTSALRMNCTYPYILPNAHLPTAPVIETMDAGFRDNYGMLTSARFVHVFKNWIKTNTSGVVFVEIRCWPKVNPIRGSDSQGWITSLLHPATASALITDLQDFDQDEIVATLADLLGENQVERILFSYHPVQKQSEASMSLHLSQREKLDLVNAFSSPENQESLRRLVEILK